MKKLYVVLGVLFTLSVAALPAKAAAPAADPAPAATGSSSNGRKAVCKWAQEHNMQASEAVAGVCGELGVELVAKAGVSGGSTQNQLVAEAEQLHAQADALYEEYLAAQEVVDEKLDAALAFQKNNCHDPLFAYWQAGEADCNDFPEWAAIKQAYLDASSAESYAWDEYQNANQAAHQADLDAGLVEPTFCELHPSDCLSK